MLHLDFETRSDLDLPKVGAHNYARGRSTDILCAGYAFDDEEVELWVPGEPLAERLIDYIEAGGSVWCHNAAFEREMCNNVGVRKYGFPYLYDDQLVCTMAMAFSMGLPGSLEKSAAALGVTEQKDLEGSRVMMQLCAPREVKPDGTIVWWQDAEKMERLFKYCRQDVRVERMIGKRMLKLSSFEKKIWMLDQKINSRGIHIDIPAAKAASAMITEEKQRLDLQMRLLSDNQIATCNAIAQIKAYLSEYGIQDIDSLAKSDVVELLKLKNLPADCRAILELRQEAGKATTAKVSAMVQRSGSDDRFRGGFQYSGANTRRWAARGIQLQNLKRPTLPQSVIDYVLEALPKGITASQLDAVVGSPLSIISECIRGFIAASEGCELLSCDFSSIEARVLAWLAGQESVLDIFKGDGKIYEHAACNIFQRSIEHITSSERQIGKVAVLALGYGGGVGALQSMSTGYGVSLAPAFEALWNLASLDQKERVEYSWHLNNERFDIPREEYIASELTKINWREANSSVVSYWEALESAAIEAVTNPKAKFQAGQAGREVLFMVNGSFLFCKLPSSGVIVFPYPEIRTIKTPWGQNKQALTYMTEDGTTKKWDRVKTYGGSLAENVTQSLARDLLAEALLRLEARNFSVVAHIHDEIVCENKIGEKKIEDMIQIMTEVPVWAKGLPISAGGWNGKRFRK